LINCWASSRFDTKFKVIEGMNSFINHEFKYLPCSDGYFPYEHE